jgi:hypothetical protein
MQMISAFVAEVLCIFVIGGQSIVWKAFNLYISLKIIATIDNIYLNASQDSTMEKMQKGKWQPLVMYKKLSWRTRPLGNKLWLIAYTCTNMFYKCFYFYFFPFCTMLINIISPRCTEVLVIDELQSYALHTPVYMPMCEPKNQLILETVFSSASSIWAPH